MPALPFFTEPKFAPTEPKAKPIQELYERMRIMTQGNAVSRMYLANIIEENEQGFHRESLWYGGAPENLGLMLIDVMKDWYEPNKDLLDPSIIDYHKMLEDKEALTFEKLANSGFNADGMSIRVKISNDLNEMFSFVVAEICNIYAKNGETPNSFASLAEFKEHFVNTYDIDEGLRNVLDSVNELTLSKALVLIDFKYEYTKRHFRAGQANQE